jgi:hypothetical protein
LNPFRKASPSGRAAKVKADRIAAVEEVFAAFG